MLRHHYNSFGSERTRRIRDSLRMISAGVGDDAAAQFFRRKGSDLVVRPAQLECADRLQVFRLEVELAGIRGLLILMNMGFNQWGAHRNTAQARLGFANVMESDHGPR